MSMTRTTILLASAASLALGTASAASAQHYVRASAGLSALMDSDNSGNFTASATLQPVGVPVTPDTSVAWTTEFENGVFLSGAYGYELPVGLRIEGELSYTSNDVDTHAGVTLAGSIAADGLDAANLLIGTDAAVGIEIGDLVADGQGSVETLGVAANVYYDFDFEGSPFSAYVGGGLGLAQVDVDYSPSGFVIVDDNDTVLLYQVMVGGEYALSDTLSLYGGYRYRATPDVETEVSLFPADLDIEYSANILEAGVRVAF